MDSSTEGPFVRRGQWGSRTGSTVAPPSVSSIMSRRSSSASVNGNDERLLHRLERGTTSPRRRGRGPLLSLRKDSTATESKSVDIRSEARRLISQMNVDLNHVTSSVDLRAQTDKALLFSADHRYHVAAKFSHALAEGVFHPARPLAEEPGYHFIPMSTAPQPILRLHDTETVSRLASQRSASSSSSMVHRKQSPSTAHSSSSALPQRPNWNISTEPEENAVAAPMPLSVEEPTKEWLQRRRRSAESARRSHDEAATNKVTDPAAVGSSRRTLRFSGCDSDALLSGGMVAPSKKNGAVSHARGGGGGRASSAAALHRDPVVMKGVPRMRTAPPLAGISSTGLWARPSQDAAPLHSTSFSIGGSHHTSSVMLDNDRSASFANAFSVDVTARALGMEPPAPEEGQGGAESKERFCVRFLQSMNLLEADPSRWGAGDALQDPVRNGALLCRLVNHIVTHSQSRKHLRPVPIHQGSAVTFQSARLNFVNALARIRECTPPSGCDPVPPSLLYLDPREIILQNNLKDLWSLLDCLLRTFIAKATREEPDVPVSAAPTLGRVCDIYTPRNMQLLEQSVCSFLYTHGVLAEPAAHGMPRDDDMDVITRPTEAPFLPVKRSKWVTRTTPFRSLSLPSVFPFLMNGTVLCDLVSVVLGEDIPVHRNPRVPSVCLANIEAAQKALLGQYPARISNLFLCDPRPVIDGDKAFIMFLLEDIMRLSAKAPPRKSRPNESQAPFVIAHTSAAMERSELRHEASNSSSHHDTSLASTINPQVAAASHIAQRYPQPERQSFVSARVEVEQGQYDSLQQVLGGTTYREGSQSSVASQPFVSTKAYPPPTTIRMRTAGISTTAPSSGRSIVPSDEVQEDIQDEAPDPPALLPRHLEYLLALHVDDKELGILTEWLVGKLGLTYRHVAADKSFEVYGKTVSLTHPCMIFSDGVVLAHLVRVLSYHKCPPLDTIQKAPKTAAAKRNNIKKVLEYLRTEKKILVDYVFLEEVLVSGDLRAIILVLRALRLVHKNHK